VYDNRKVLVKFEIQYYEKITSRRLLLIWRHWLTTIGEPPTNIISESIIYPIRSIIIIVETFALKFCLVFHRRLVYP